MEHEVEAPGWSGKKVEVPVEVARLALVALKRAAGFRERWELSLQELAEVVAALECLTEVVGDDAL